MALFGKSSGNKTLYSKEKYNIVGKRVLNEPFYLVTTANGISYISCPNMSSNEIGMENYSQKGPYKTTGFYSEKIIPGAAFNGSNDIIELHFTFNGSTMTDHVGRNQYGGMSVFIDAADYANLDIKEFVDRVDADFKTHPHGDLLFSYPVIWNAKTIQKELNDPTYLTIPSKNFYGEENLRNIPQTIPYDKAIRTKDGRPVIGSVLTNPTLKDLKTSKQTTPTQSKPAAPAKIAPAPQATKANPNEKRIKELQFELDETKSNIKKLQSKVKTLEAEISSLQQSNSPAPGRK